uniref:uncharacterized protein LOC109964063 isoform X3 n=1 Tax=Monopterus albus TaxID=43700 RepID=UPI0009B3B227|nr:uncharacterized protein LOC109964063 isoform X3 [Monopterus albus]
MAEQDTDITQQHTAGSASSCTSTNSEAKNDNSENMEQVDVRNSGSSSYEGSMLNVKEDSTVPQVGDSDCKGETSKKEALTLKAEIFTEEDHTGEKKAPETTPLPALGDKKDDGPKAELDEGSPEFKDLDTEAGGAEEDHTGEKKAPETTPLPALGDKKDDGPKDELDKGSPGSKDVDTEAGGVDRGALECGLPPEDKNTTSSQAALAEEPSVEEDRGVWVSRATK